MNLLEMAYRSVCPHFIFETIKRISLKLYPCQEPNHGRPTRSHPLTGRVIPAHNVHMRKQQHFISSRFRNSSHVLVLSVPACTLIT